MHNDESVTRSLAIINSSSRGTLIHRLTGCDGGDQDGDGGDTPRHQRASRRHVQRSVRLCSCPSTGFRPHSARTPSSLRTENQSRASNGTALRRGSVHTRRRMAADNDSSLPAAGDGRESLIAELAADTKYWQPWCCESSLAGTVLLTATAAAPPSTTASSSSSSSRRRVPSHCCPLATSLP